ncbi:GGDEF domain-containing protein [Bacillus ndiopicus]|uniref:GGDEF domain-containing protein n=1 Tax=Bacillus ndiopicus TaxID=1347368 RepID=UPI0005A96FAF|nr:GGDEF domain-containing protein [Bacillus ndiopicus]
MNKGTLKELAITIKHLRAEERYEEIIILSDEIENKLFKLNEVDDVLEILKQRIMAYIYTGSYEEAFSTLFQFEQICSSHPSNAHYSLYYGLAGILYTVLSHTEMAKEVMHKAEVIAREKREYKQLCYTYSNLSNLYYDLKDYKNAKEYAVKALETVPSWDYEQIDLLPIKGNAVIAFSYVGDIEAASDLYIKMQEITRTYGKNRDDRNRALLYNAKMALEFAKGCIDQAIEAAEKAKQIFIGQGDLYMVKVMQRALIDYYKQSNKTEKLVSAQEEYIELLEKHEQEAYNRALLKFQLDEKKRKYKMASFIDPLTQIYNRGYMEHQAPKHLLEAAYNNHFVGCVIFDIDYFKQVNDVYGHLIGDDIIKFVATSAAQLFAQYDAIFVRYGGDEFIACVRTEDVQQFEEIIEKLHSFFKTQSFLVKGEHLQINISIGAYMINATKVEDFTELLKAADEELYVVKRNGRNAFKIAFATQ